MKLNTGILACVAVATLCCDRSGVAAETAPATVVPKLEHWALISHTEYLDGPRLEAMAPVHRSGPVDEAGNMYIFTYGALRVIRSDGDVRTIAGDDRWVNSLGIDDGPAAFLSAMAKGGGFGIATVWLSVTGRPLEGEDKGRVYVGIMGGAPYKVFRNKEKGDRWWMQRFGAGTTQLPTEVGKTISVKDADLSSAQIGVGDMQWKGNYYTFDEAKGEITCVLSYSDYAGKAVHPNPKFKNIGLPAQFMRASDGSFYAEWYYSCYSEGIIYRISADRSNVELVAHCKNGVHNRDGAAIGEAGYWGGPYLAGPIADGVIPISTIDGNSARRIKDGRTSKLCADGEWRETADNRNTAVCFKGWFLGPDMKTVWAPYSGEEHNGDSRAYRIYPVDFNKPTVTGATGVKR